MTLLLTTTKKPSHTSTKDVEVSTLLVDLASKGKLQDLHQWKNAHINKHEYGQLQNAKNALELCQYVCEMEDGLRDEMQVLKGGKNADRGKLIVAANAIEKLAFKKLYAFEGELDPDAKCINNSKKGSQKKGTTYNSVGARVMKYKQFLSGSKKKKFIMARNLSNVNPCWVVSTEF